MPEGKPCIRCGSTERYKKGCCAPCSRASSLSWKNANPERAASNNKAWKKANPERVASNREAWRNANPEKVRMQSLKSFRMRKARISQSDFNAVSQEILGNERKAKNG